jgi:hypothetical protein
MTALLGGSVLLIAVSAAALVYGWLNGDDTFIWTSIVATAAAAVLVVVAYVRSSKEPAVVTGDSGPGPATDEQPTQAQPAAADAGATQVQPAADRPEESQPAEADADAKTQPVASEDATESRPAGEKPAAEAGDEDEDEDKEKDKESPAKP